MKLKYNGSVVFYVISFLLLLRLYLISPINYRLIDPDISAVEGYFISLKFYFLFIWTVLFIYIFRFLDKKRSRLFYPFLLWNSIFFLLSLTVNLGFDLTDEGWQLAKAWGMFNGDFANNADLIWGSSFIQGIWMLIYDFPNVLWARISYLTVLPLTCVIVYLILCNFFSPKVSFFSSIVGFLFFYRSFLFFNVLNYYTLPIMSLLASFLFLAKHNNKTESDRTKFLVLSAFFAGISIHLKFTFALIIPFFCVYLYIFRNELKNKFRMCVYYYSSFTIVVIAGFAVLLLAGSFSDLAFDNSRLSIVSMIKAVFGYTEVNSSLNYSFRHLSRLYFKDFNSIIYGSLALFAFLFVSVYSATKNKSLKYINIFINALFLHLTYKFHPESHLFPFQLVLTSLVLLKINNPDHEKKFFFLLFIFNTVLLVSFLGSGLSFYAGMISLGLYGTLTFTLCYIYESKSKLLDGKILLYSLVLFILISQFSKNYSPYRDLPSSYLNTMFSSPELFGIYSFKERIDVVDEFMDFAKFEGLTDEKVIFVGMPMFYFLLNVIPPVSETHDVILGFEQLKKEVISAQPDVIVIPVQSPRGNLWPLPQNADFWTRDGFERSTAHYYEFYREYMRENHFKNIFENAMFAVYRRGEPEVEETEVVEE